MQKLYIIQEPSLNIPDTVIFKRNQIHGWFFSLNNQIMTKSKMKWKEEIVKEHFLTKAKQD